MLGDDSSVLEVGGKTHVYYHLVAPPKHFFFQLEGAFMALATSAVGPFTITYAAAQNVTGRAFLFALRRCLLFLLIARPRRLRQQLSQLLL